MNNLNFINPVSGSITYSNLFPFPNFPNGLLNSVTPLTLPDGSAICKNLYLFPIVPIVVVNGLKGSTFFVNPPLIIVVGNSPVGPSVVLSFGLTSNLSFCKNSCFVFISNFPLGVLIPVGVVTLKPNTPNATSAVGRTLVIFSATISLFTGLPNNPVPIIGNPSSVLPTTSPGSPISCIFLSSLLSLPPLVISSSTPPPINNAGPNIGTKYGATSATNPPNLPVACGWYN